MTHCTTSPVEIQNIIRHTMLESPKSKLRTAQDLEIFQASQVYKDVVQYVERLGASVHGLELTDKSLPRPPAIEGLLTLFKKINDIIDAHPVQIETNSRFGKIEFRDFFDALKLQSSDLIHELEFPFTPQQQLDLSVYLYNSFGDRERIDYGSGHELNFLCFLLCLDKLHYLTTDSDSSVVLLVFAKYLQTMRRLQLSYWLEPAGSHGVWGLDDYHFLPFLFGAAQLSPLKRPRPLSIHQTDYVEEFKDKYLYFQCVDFINKVKTGAQGLRWTSPMLDDISGVKTWSKIEEGMIKMYKAEVLGKLPVVQHFMFSSILPAPELPEHEDDDHLDHGDGCGHNHAILSTWGDCCGIKVPSAVAAAQQQNRHKIPFD